jgi:tetratricopeptide (TPR) repeat protein
MYVKSILILILLLSIIVTPIVSFSENDHPGLIEKARKEVEAHPDDIAMRLELGLAYEKAANIEEAIKQYTIILETTSQTVSAQDQQTLAFAKNQLAWLYAEQAIHLDQALQLATEAVAMRPAAGMRDTLGWVHYKRGEYRLARDQFQQAMKHSPNQPSIVYHLALSQTQFGNTHAAIQALKKALAMSPDFKEAHDAQALLITLEHAMRTDTDDNSLSSEEYFALGIPRKIETIEVYGKIYSILFELAEQTKHVLPKYDSPQSHEIFHLIFSPTTLDKILSQSLDSQEQQQLSLTCYQMLDALSSLYYQHNESSAYSDEVERIGLLMFKTNLPDQYCTNMILSSKAQNLDQQTQQYLSETLLTYRERIKALSFVDETINFTSEVCGDLYAKRKEIFSKWSKEKEEY